LKLRGYIALFLICLTLLLLDVVQRFVVAPWVKLRPDRRKVVLGRWQRFLARFILFMVSRVGGAVIPALPRIQGSAGTLVLMNHQSVLDIPLVVASIETAYPRIITRTRYERWIPLISHMTRLYQYPTVDPSANPGEMRRMLANIKKAARDADVPMAIFPEGTRSKDGSIGSFRTTGLKLLLKSRPWTVHLLVVDGFWQRAKLKDFLGGMAAIRGKMTHAGSVEWTDPRSDPDPFIDRIREQMERTLEEMRAPAPI